MRRSRRGLAWGRLLALACVAYAAASPSARSQVVRGTIVDSETREPVVLAYVGLLAPGREVVVAALAEFDGSFSLEAPKAGSYFLYIDRTGYRPILDGLFELGAGGEVELSIGMSPEPVELAPLVVGVEGGVPDLSSVGFYERRDGGFGHFIEREALERASVTNLSDVLRNIPRLQVTTPAPSALAPTQVLSPQIFIRYGTEYCSPTLYIDGRPVVFGTMQATRRAVRPDDFVDPSEVEAVEVYTSPADTPLMYENTGGCGVVVIWTRKR